MSISALEDCCFYSYLNKKECKKKNGKKKNQTVPLRYVCYLLNQFQTSTNVISKKQRAVVGMPLSLIKNSVKFGMIAAFYKKKIKLFPQVTQKLKLSTKK